MSHIFNDPVKKTQRRTLRQQQTDAEKLLWFYLRNKQMNGYKFFRQFSVGYYILDFYCPLLRLAVEVDGGQHAEEKALIHDEKRTQFLAIKNIKVLRFWDNEVLADLDIVLDRIYSETLSRN